MTAFFFALALTGLVVMVEECCGSVAIYRERQED
jgi:hypothetical protein